MKVQKIAAGAVFVGAVLAGMLGAGAAQADSTEGNGGVATSTNPTLNDAMGFGVVNHMKGNGVDNGGNGYNGDFNGVGNARRGPDQNPSSFAGNRVDTEIPATVTLQHPDMTTGNKVTPRQK